MTAAKAEGFAPIKINRVVMAGVNDADLEAAIVAVAARKPERHLFREAPERLARVMAQTGG